MTPTAIRFTEEMKGFVAFGERDFQRGWQRGRESDTPLMFHLTIEAADIDRFVADARHEAKAEGWVRCEALGGRLPVQDGIFNLFVDHTTDEKRMLYRLHFCDGVGHPLTLSGYKVIRNDRGLDLWKDTTTLFVRLFKGHVDAAGEGAAELVAAGILRILIRDFARQLTTFRARGPSRGARTGALARFLTLFLGELWAIYGRLPATAVSRKSQT